MGKIIKKVTTTFIAIFTFLMVLPSSYISADETNSVKHYIGSVENTGKDTGYSESNKLEESDPHYGWKLGDFFVTGYTSDIKDDNNKPIFLKNVGDKVALYFNLGQDINMLNGKGELSIAEDDNGYDKNFEVPKQNFGRGTLIIRHTDYQNKVGEPIVYTNYLEAKVLQGADTKVELFEEGDYEIALDYEIKDSPRNVGGISIFPSYSNYRISFNFSVRNGNCMVYPFDISTGDELSNTSITEDGFKLDLAQSRYLNTNIKKEVLKEGASGLIEDTRYNGPAKDGDEYTEEGIYTITVSNRYTKQETVKKIYVGSNDILKAYVTTGLSIKDIEKKVDDGAKINSDGTILLSNGKLIKVDENQNYNDTNNSNNVDTGLNLDSLKQNNIIVLIVGLSIILIIIMVIILQNNRKKKKEKQEKRNNRNRKYKDTPDNSVEDKEE